jgi:hypothetical protein
MIRHDARPRAAASRDGGAVLPLVLVLSVVLAVLVLSVATYTATSLRYGTVTADRSDRLSAADAGMRYAIDQLKIRNEGCIGLTPTQLPRSDVDFNGATASITCQLTARVDEAGQSWAAVLTGEGVPNNDFLISTQGGNSKTKILDGPVWMSRVTSGSFQFAGGSNKDLLQIKNGPLNYHDGGSCTSNITKQQLPAELSFEPDLIFGPLCVPDPWTTTHRSPEVDPALAGLEVLRGDRARNLTNGLFAISHITGNVANPNNAVGNTPDTWAGSVNANVSATSRWLIAPPNGPLTGGATQTVKVVARKGTNSNDPTVSVNLFEDGTLISPLVASTPITSTTGQTLTGTFGSSAIRRPEKVEIQVVIAGAGGGPSARNSAQIATIEWEAAFEADTATDGSYEDIGPCRVFYPGRYVTPPAIAAPDGQAARNVYFRSGDYVFDLPPANSAVRVLRARVTAGTAAPSETQIPNAACAQARAADPANGDPNQAGATFYMAENSHIVIGEVGSLEIHARRQGDAFVSIQALCDPAASWCTSGVDKQAPETGPRVSTLTATTGPPVVYTTTGDGRELVAHGLVYAPRATMDFGNVTSIATQKVLGGLVVSRLVLQSSASTENFEIKVSPRPIESRVRLTSTAVKNGATSIQAVVQYRPNNPEISNRVRVNSWRVCETAGCS